MAYTPRVIAPIGQALNRYYKPWLTPEDSFQDLEDVYVRRGVVKKRNGFATFARVPSLNANVPLNVSGMSAASPMVVTTSANHGLTSGQRIWIEGAAGGGFSGLNYSWYEVTVVSPTTFTIAGLQPSGTVSGSIQVIDSTGFGTYTANSATIYLSIVGLLTYSIQNAPSVLMAFDQRYAYQYNTGTNQFDLTNTAGPTPETWTGRNWEYFQGYNYYEYLWVTNWNDNIRYWDGALWHNFLPSVDGSVTVSAARVVVAFKNRLILLNTTEGGTEYPNRARWSWSGSPTDTNAFRQDMFNGAGFADADTDDNIVGVEFNRDQMIVFFENSVWTLSYTQNDILPFIWQRVNVQYGSMSTNSVVSLDTNIVTLSPRGAIAANSTDVGRIDLQIPETIFDIESSLIESSAPNFRRVSSVQNFDLQQVIWTYPSEQESGTEVQKKHVRNNAALVYNYAEKTWSTYNVNWTVMCNFRTLDEKTWGNTPTTWGDAAWPWGTSFASVDKLLLLAGSDSGRVFEISDTISQDVDDTGAAVNFGFDVATKRYNAYIEMGQLS